MIHILSYKKLPFRYYAIQKRSFFHYYFIKGARLSNCPLSALFGRSGSAILWRPKAIRSARPCFTRSSAYCGSVKRPTAITGTETARLISVTRSPLKLPWTRPGAHINSSWRCTTRVTWRAFTPHSCSRYAATAAASCTLYPPSTSSLALIRQRIGKFPPVFLNLYLAVSKEKRHETRYRETAQKIHG